MTASRAHHVRSRSVGQLRTSSTSDQLTAGVRRSFLDEGCRLAPATECFFPTPHRGQSLTSFLSSADFGTCGELDRENAHIYVSEALIAAFEQMRCSRALNVADEDDDDSDEEIARLRQRIRIRRKERLREKALQQQLNKDGQPSGVWCRAPAVATTSTSPLSSAYSSPCFQVDISDNDDDIDEYELSDESNLSRVRECGLSLSLASLYSDADLQKMSSVCWPQEDSTQTGSSAEAVALNLLRRFSEKQLPKASDLQWLVSEQDAAQSLLPLPDAWPVSPDQVEEDYYALHKMRLRGNSEWAPPREQIIFSMQPELRRKDQLAKQNYRCAGCGLRVNQAFRTPWGQYSSICWMSRTCTPWRTWSRHARVSWWHSCWAYRTTVSATAWHVPSARAVVSSARSATMQTSLSSPSSCPWLHNAQAARRASTEPVLCLVLVQNASVWRPGGEA